MSASMYEIFNWDGGKDSPRPKQMQLSLAGSSINIDDPIGEQIKLELLTFISLSLMFCIKNELCALHVCLSCFCFRQIFVLFQNLKVFKVQIESF